jgi:hypothetical protein
MCFSGTSVRDDNLDRVVLLPILDLSFSLSERNI